VVWDDETSEAYYLLMSIRSIDVLVKYTDDSIPAIRAAIFAGLAQRNADHKVLGEILNKHLTDTGKFTLSPTEVVITWSVREYMQMVVSHKTDNEPDLDFKARIEKIRRERHIIIAGAHHGIIAKDSLLKADSLISSQEGIKVISFVLTVKSKTIRSGNFLSARTKRNIKKLRSGERIFIDNIIVEWPDNIPRQMGGITLKIK
jgi:hypothetical protein